MYQAGTSQGGKRRATRQNSKEGKKEVIHTKEVHHSKEDTKDQGHPHHLKPQFF